MPLLVDVHVCQVEEGDIVCNRPRKADLPLGAKEAEAARIVNDGAHDGVRVRVGPIHGLGGEGSGQGRQRNKRAVRGNYEAVAMPFADFGRGFEFSRGCP